MQVPEATCLFLFTITTIVTIIIIITITTITVITIIMTISKTGNLLTGGGPRSNLSFYHHYHRHPHHHNHCPHHHHHGHQRDGDHHNKYDEQPVNRWRLQKQLVFFFFL